MNGNQVLERKVGQGQSCMGAVSNDGKVGKRWIGQGGTTFDALDVTCLRVVDCNAMPTMHCNMA